jgi:Hypothetical protein (DUF2513)
MTELPQGVWNEARYMDLCREILRQIEESPESASPTVKVDGHSPEEISYHVKLLGEADLVEVGFADGRFNDEEPDGSVRTRFQKVYSPVSLTWQGHEFLDAARDDTIWQRGKERVLKVAGGLAFDLLFAALKAEIRERTGLDL